MLILFVRTNPAKGGSFRSTTIFAEMSQHLADDEAKQLCFEFEAEIARLEAA